MAAPQSEFSDELVALLGRAERAEVQARRLCDENNWWRHSVRKQLDYMYEQGREFRAARDRSSPNRQESESLSR
jgi:hypothetical protein